MYDRISTRVRRKLTDTAVVQCQIHRKKYPVAPKGFNFVVNSPLHRKCARDQYWGPKLENYSLCREVVSTEQAVQGQSANLTTSVLNVVQSDTGHRNVGRVESTNGPTHNNGTGCGKMCVANISHQSIFSTTSVAGNLSK